MGHIIDTFIGRYPAKPGFRILSIKIPQMLICGKKGFLRQIFGGEVVGGHFIADGKNKILVRINKRCQLFFLTYMLRLPSASCIFIN